MWYNYDININNDQTIPVHKTGLTGYISELKLKPGFALNGTEMLIGWQSLIVFKLSCRHLKIPLSSLVNQYCSEDCQGWRSEADGEQQMTNNH
ncbi:MAG: hypothetical protein V7K35_03085 [Nostoc sp.]|uniref:hypothetical protein n=1 Tax=Nostoc sp. TaxID=1180 RepID=UPI002FF7EDE3